ncbi:MAG: hypothetical protein IT291_05540 [Deltaproteobacteria bacterium]|nr:hypothetical protein [Deltaproteobacteria bacterium]
MNARYDDGYVLQGLDDNWSFMGANAMEWAVGLVIFLMIGSFARSPASAMPLMIGGWILTTTTLASTRRNFPDEERGVRNAVMTACGFPPPGIPSPSLLQPVWSGAPMRELPQNCRFVQLGLEELFSDCDREFLYD